MTPTLSWQMKGKTDKNYKENSKLNRKEENLNS